MTILLSAIMQNIRRHAGLVLILCSLLLGGTSEAWAGAGDTAPGTCTNASTYDIAYPAPGTGIFSEIKAQIDSNLAVIGSGLFTSIVTSSNIIAAAKAACTLYIAIYGLMFAFGMVQSTAYELVIRLAKISVVYVLFTSSGYDYFNKTFGSFFFDGTDQIISKITSTVLAGLPYDPNVTFGQPYGGTDYYGGPFGPMDTALAMVISPKMAATIIAAFTTGPYGPLIGLIFLMSVGSFLKSLMTAMWVYIMALVMRVFLFSLAPIFLPCILFSRTKPLFDGWLAQIVNSCLQPIFLFSFFSFFAILFEACLDQVFQVPACWTPMSEAVKGAPFEGQWWRFAIWDCGLNNWAPFDNSWGFDGPNLGSDNSCWYHPINPLGITLPLTLWLISDLAGRFNGICVQIAQEISSAFTDLRMGAERMGDWFAGGGGGQKGPSQQAGGASKGERTGPGALAHAPASAQGRQTGSNDKAHTPAQIAREQQKAMTKKR